MRIKYKVQLDDCLVFNRHVLKTNPLILKALRKGQVWWACGPLAGGLLLSIIKKMPPGESLLILLILGVALSLPMFFLYPLYFKIRNEKYINKLYEKDENKGVLGVHEMVVSDDYLEEITEHNDSKIQWDSISKIESIADYTFVYTGDITAYIIPHKNIISGNCMGFIEKLSESFRKNVGQAI